MENREAFTGISAEPEERVDEVNWRQKNYNQASRGKGYLTRGTSSSYQQGSNYHCSNASRGRGYDPQGGNSAKKVGTNNKLDVQCLLCGLKGHKVVTCRKLASVRSNLDTHLSDTPFAIWQPIWRPCLLERVYKPIRTPHWCGVLQSSITDSIRDRV